MRKRALCAVCPLNLALATPDVQWGLMLINVNSFENRRQYAISVGKEKHLPVSVKNSPLLARTGTWCCGKSLGLQGEHETYWVSVSLIKLQPLPHAKITCICTSIFLHGFYISTSSDVQTLG